MTFISDDVLPRRHTSIFNKRLHVFIRKWTIIKYSYLFSTELKPTLFNWMLLEGLAAEFEEWAMQRFYNCKVISAHKNTCSINELKLRLQQIIQIDKNKSSWDHYDWFYNFDRQANLPINCAYQVGAWLVKNYCEQNQLLPHQALKVSSQKFLRFGSALCEK